MVVNLPYTLREGTVAYAAKVMANFEALIGAYNTGNVPGLGSGDLNTLLTLMYTAIVKAGQPGNTSDVIFPDGESVEQKFNAGTLNASLFTGEGMFYFNVGDDGHLYCTTSGGVDADDFVINNEGHLVYTLNDPAGSPQVQTFDLGQVRGPQGESGSGNMQSSIYDPRNEQKDVNLYTGWFTCPAAGWGGYYLTYDATFDGDKTYYVRDGDNYIEAVVVAGNPVTVNTYYEKLEDNTCLLTDANQTAPGVGAAISDHITAVTGHALIGPTAECTDAAVEAWAEAKIRDAGQGDGNQATGATNNSSWLKLKALGDIPTENVPLRLTFWL